MLRIMTHEEHDGMKTYGMNTGLCLFNVNKCHLSLFIWVSVLFNVPLSKRPKRPCHVMYNALWLTYFQNIPIRVDQPSSLGFAII